MSLHRIVTQTPRIFLILREFCSHTYTHIHTHTRHCVLISTSLSSCYPHLTFSSLCRSASLGESILPRCLQTLVLLLSNADRPACDTAPCNTPCFCCCCSCRCSCSYPYRRCLKTSHVCGGSDYNIHGQKPYELWSRRMQKEIPLEQK